MEGILAEGIYRITYLKEDGVTKKLFEKTALVPGHILKEEDEDKNSYNNIIKVELEPVRGDRFYQVSCMWHPIDFKKEDKRLIYIGNFEIVVTGKALLELAEERNLSFVGEKPIFGNTYKEVKEGILSFIEGCKYWDIKDRVVDHVESLLRLEQEQQRIRSQIINL